ncbi:MAG: hypothetical protein WD795_09895 [Woeseia sp.]
MQLVFCIGAAFEKVLALAGQVLDFKRSFSQHQPNIQRIPDVGDHILGQFVGHQFPIG